MFGAHELMKELEEKNNGDFRIQPVPCVGRCAGAPIAVVGMNPIEKATTENVGRAVKDKDTEPVPPKCIDYETYRKEGGYQLLLDCLEGKHQRDDIIDLLEDANLPAPKMVAINIDEGEPGTFKDRYYLEQDPHRFIEGTLIAAWAIEDVEAIYLYLRDEYAGCRVMLELELEKLKQDPPCELPPIYLRRGAGAYICGEESAMIESIEGKKGMPRLRPPYVAQVGIFGKPTLEQNMESLLLMAGTIVKVFAHSRSAAVSRNPACIWHRPVSLSVNLLMNTVAA